MRLKFIEPMLATWVETPPEGSNWIHEVKQDGYRTDLIESGKVHAYTRRGADWTGKYASVVGAAAELPAKSAIIDGEMVVLDTSGVSDYAPSSQPSSTARGGSCWSHSDAACAAVR